MEMCERAEKRAERRERPYLILSSGEKENLDNIFSYNFLCPTTATFKSSKLQSRLLQMLCASENLDLFFDF